MQDMCGSFRFLKRRERMIEIKMNHNQPELVIVIRADHEEMEAVSKRHQLQDLAEDSFLNLLMALQREEEEEDDGEIIYDLTMLSSFMDKLREQDMQEEAYHFALGILHIPHTDTGVEKIKEEIAEFDDGEGIFLNCFINAIDEYCSDLEEED